MGIDRILVTAIEEPDGLESTIHDHPILGLKSGRYIIMLLLLDRDFHLQ